MKGAVYFNPSSGSQRVAREELREAVAAHQLDFVEIVAGFDVESDVDQRVRKGQKLFIAAGGDGTINHVAQRIVQSRATLAVIPIGTLNHFARDLSLPLDWRPALEIALRGPVRHIDVARVNDRYFLNNISLGLYPEMVEHREKLRGGSNVRAYLYAALNALRKFPHVSLVLETPHHSEVIRTHIFLVSVNPYDLSRIGLIAPRMSLQGGRLSVYWLPHLPKPEFIKALARYVGGRMDAGQFRFLYTPELKVQSSHSSLRVGMDGELFRMRPPLKISIAPQSLAVKVADSRAVPRGVMVGTVATG